MKRAEGWLELRLPLEANEELEEIQPTMRAHPAVLLLRYSIYAAAKKWDMALEVASFLHQQMPDDPCGGVQAAIALLRLGRPQEAKALSLPLAEKFPNNPTIPYNLACYCAQLGEMQEAQEWFRAAMALDPNNVRQKGIEDPDLEPMWRQLSETPPK